MNSFTLSDLLAFSCSGLVEHSEGPFVVHGHQVLLILMEEHVAAEVAESQVADLAKSVEPAIVGKNSCTTAAEKAYFQEYSKTKSLPKYRTVKYPRVAVT